METADDLIAERLIINDVVVLIDREQGGKENLATKYNHVQSILSLTDILQTLLHSPLVKTDEKRMIEKFLLERSA